MTADETAFRRQVLRTSAIAGLGSLLAGCAGDDVESEYDPDAWAGVEEIVLEGHAQGWEGVSPAPIEGAENPTLVLFEGETYDVTWENADGEVHNFVVRDDDGEPLETSEDLADEGEHLTLSLEADESMDAYVCEYHETQMGGDVVVIID